MTSESWRFGAPIGGESATEADAHVEWDTVPGPKRARILRHLFETVVERCLREGLVGGEGLFRTYHRGASWPSRF